MLVFGFDNQGKRLIMLIYLYRAWFITFRWPTALCLIYMPKVISLSLYGAKKNSVSPVIYNYWQRWWWFMFYGHFCALGRLNGPNNPKGNEANWKMKQPSDNMLTTRFEHGGSDLWSHMLLLGPRRRPSYWQRNIMFDSKALSVIEVWTIFIKWFKFNPNAGLLWQLPTNTGISMIWTLT